MQQNKGNIGVEDHCYNNGKRLNFWIRKVTSYQIIALCSKNVLGCLCCNTTQQILWFRFS